MPTLLEGWWQPWPGPPGIHPLILDADGVCCICVQQYFYQLRTHLYFMQMNVLLTA